MAVDVYNLSPAFIKRCGQCYFALLIILCGMGAGTAYSMPSSLAYPIPITTARSSSDGWTGG
jgi:hypothetical protein